MADQGEDVKIWKLTSDSESNIAIYNNRATLVGSKKNFITTSDGGNVLYGPTSIVAGSESIKTGGIFNELPDMTQNIPSTTSTPIPSKIPIPPIHVAFDLADDVSYFMMLLVVGG